MKTTATPAVAIALELSQAVHSMPTSDTTVAQATTHACLNCGASVPQRFCGQCGQDVHHTQRFTLGRVLHEVPHILHVEKGLFYTVTRLLRQPAATLRDYLAGQRQQHFKPLAYVLLTAGASSFLFMSLHIQPLDPHDPRLPPGVQQLLTRMATQSTQYMSWLMVGLLPFVSLISGALLRRLRFNYAEHLVLNAYITGTTTVLSLPLMLTLFFYNSTGAAQTVSQASLALALVYSWWVYGSLLKPTGRPRWRRYVRGLLTALLVFTVQLILIYAVLLAVNWPLVQQALRK